MMLHRMPCWVNFSFVNKNLFVRFCVQNQFSLGAYLADKLKCRTKTQTAKHICQTGDLQCHFMWPAKVKIQASAYIVFCHSSGLYLFAKVNDGLRHAQLCWFSMSLAQILFFKKVI